jgi:uncharacterized protein (TIGR03435 family)
MRRFALSVVLLALSTALLAQTPAFEVASVKRNTSDSKQSVDVGPGRFTATRISVRDLIKLAYPIGETIRNDDQVAGGPDWTGQDRFDVIATGGPATLAKPAAGAFAPSAGAALDALRAMLRQLLAERFKLVVHEEKRPLPGYALTRMQSDTFGSHLRKSTTECCGGFKVTAGQLTGKAVTMPMLVTLLSNLSIIGRIVEDRSSLDGPFDFDLTWAAAATDAPSIFTAIQEQLGLKLEPTRAPVSVLIIDSVSQPTPD